MLKFLCIGYFDPGKMDLLSQPEVERVMRDCPAHMETLCGTGQVTLVAGVGIATKYLRRDGGNLSLLDQEQEKSRARIGCVFVVEAAGMEEAIRLASLHPTTQIAAGEQLGWFTEIRPIDYFYAGGSRLEQATA